MKKKIYIYGVTSSHNLGDNVICDTFFYFVKTKSPSSRIIVRDINYVPLIFKVIRKILIILGLQYKKLNSFAQKYFSFWGNSRDAIVVFAGGQLFYDYFVNDIISIVKAASYKKIGVYFYGCGTGCIEGKNKNDLIEILKNPNVVMVTLRDDYIGLRDAILNISIVPDVAICCNVMSVSYRKEKSNIIGIGVISIDNYNKQNHKQVTEEYYISSMCGMIVKLKQVGYEIELFSNGNEEDQLMADKIQSFLKNNFPITIAPQPSTAKELITIENKYTYVIASRLHAMIIAYSYNIPFWGICWDEKIISFCKCIGTYDNYTMLNDIDNIDIKIILKKLVEGYDDSIRESLISNINQKIEFIIK